MMTPARDTSSPVARARSIVACGLAYLAAWIVFLAGELIWAANRDGPPQNAWQRLLAADIDTLVYLLFLVAAPIAWFRGGTNSGGSGGRLLRVWQCGQSWLKRVAQSPRGSIHRGAALSAVVAAASLATSACVGEKFNHLPPAYHDEYSYLFQAKTFLAGRVSYPCHPAAPLFDQMHVLNDGRFASRYFPGTGAWLVPFVAMGHPWGAQWLAGALCASLVFWCGRELAGDLAGLLAGLLTALAPGMALFSNLLLAHHPTLVGLSLFLLGYLRLLRRPSLGWAFAAGAGLGFAALCRPMTAAGVALPFGLHCLWWWLGSSKKNESDLAETDQVSRTLSLREGSPDSHQTVTGRPEMPANRDRRAPTRVVLAMAAPLLACGGLMFVYNASITGSGWKTPYSLYTDLYTPRHVYGFENVVRGERRVGPRVIEKYDAWAENLTPKLAAHNVVRRLIASGQWTLGLIPLSLALVAGLARWTDLNTGTRLIFAGIVSLNAVHVPYWFVGMHDYHYVFESGPLWLLWTAAVTIESLRVWHVQRRDVMAIWCLALLVAAVTMNYGIRGGLWSTPLDKGLAEVLFPRIRYGRFAARIADEVAPRPALVLVDDDPSDRHIDYVVNDPDLAADVLMGRYLPNTIPVAEIRRLYPERTLFLYRVRDDVLQKIPSEQ